MERLKDVKSGSTCRVTWMLGSVAEYLRKYYALEEDEIIYVNSNSGPYGLIISYRNHRVAISPDAAANVKVNLLTA